jgi:diguanylate cyclase (GGDEF)-like protein
MITKDRCLKILICDDDSQDRKLIRHYLQQIPDMDIILFEAKNTQEIQSALKKGRVNLVFMDLQMPDKSGFEWLAEIVEKQLAPVIILTGHGNEDVAVESLHSGAVGYLSKLNLSIDKVSNAIEKALGEWEKYLLVRGDLDELEKVISIDTLTGVLTRRIIMKKLDEQIKHTRRYGDRFAAIMLDIDHFKHVNDDYGHLIGDDVLENIGRILKQKIRETDSAGRYGGEEFLLILPKTDINIALTLASRIRRDIAQLTIKDSQGHVFGITVSLGITIYIAGDTKRSIINRADVALRMAKLAGRNRIRIDGTITSEAFQ